MFYIKIKKKFYLESSGFEVKTAIEKITVINIFVYIDFSLIDVDNINCVNGAISPLCC